MKIKIIRILKNPRITFKIVYNLFRVYVLKKDFIKQVAIAITYDCPCKCQFCSTDNIKDAQKDLLSTNEFEKLIDCFDKLGVLSICFTGGEPALHKDIIKLIKYVRQKNVYCSIITSCVNYSDELWMNFKKAGLNAMHISVDGIGDDHDRFRGVPGLFNKILKAVKKCRELNIEFYFNGVVTNDNIRDNSIYKIISYCQKEGIRFFILHTSASGKYSDPKYLLTKENLIEFEKIRRMDNVFWEGDGNLGGIGCPAGKEVVFVSAYGDIIPCPFIEISFGNIKSDDPKDILIKMRSYDCFSKITPVCLMGADTRFYQDWLLPIKGYKLPKRIEDHPMVSNKHEQK